MTTVGPVLMIYLFCVCWTSRDLSHTKAKKVRLPLLWARYAIIPPWRRGLLIEPYDYSKAEVAENQVKFLGATGDIQPGTSHTLDVTLTPGTYLLICNVPGHYAAGMVTPQTVTTDG